MRGVHSIRIPVHGFVEFDEWERDVINHPVFQRLRRIRQLGLTDHLFPGATHTRFEHSVGVMHVATRLFDALNMRFGPILRDRLGYDDALEGNARRLVRLAALLHDVGHAPLSHASEDLMPSGTEGQKLSHEQYSAELIRSEMRDVIDGHPVNKQRHNITSDDVAAFLEGNSKIEAERLFWRVLVVGQLDADRMDYLLRDGLHCGVAYGTFDLARIVDTLALVANRSDRLHPDLQVAIADGGRHAAEGLLLARYSMFQQVYFHRVKKAYEHHATECLKALLVDGGSSGQLPDPTTTEGRQLFLRLDDWAVFDQIKRTRDTCRHAHAIVAHEHDRVVETTGETASPEELERHQELLSHLKEMNIDCWESDADKEWYKVGRSEIQIAPPTDRQLEVPVGTPLSEKSSLVRGIPETKQRLLFVAKGDVQRAGEILQTARGPGV